MIDRRMKISLKFKMLALVFIMVLVVGLGGGITFIRVQSLIRQGFRIIDSGSSFRPADISLFKKQAAAMNRFLLAFCLVSATVVVASAFTITGGIMKQMGSVMRDLSTSSSEMGAASSQLTRASLAIAEGASLQTASIQATSSSLEQILTIAAQNTDHAANMDRFVASTKAMMDAAASNMENMGSAIRDIVASSQEIGKIIKTIDGIAFQTNLLALNAAVEAARAGEAGAGFAVVADEVRNLALRSAESARSTQGLIDQILSKIRTGENIVEGTRKSFIQVVEATNKVVLAVREITSSSDQQSKGIENIQTAIFQLDDVIHKSAATSEQTAAAAEELNAQASGLLDIVKELNRVVFGKRGYIEGKTVAAPEARKRAAGEGRILGRGGPDGVLKLKRPV